MPSIPVYNSPQVDRAPVDNAKQQVGGISARAFGASDTFREAEDLAGTYIKIQEKEGERAAAEEALRAQSNFQREVIGKQNEWRQRQGKNAEGVDKEADAWMAETAGKYIKDLKDPRAVQLFDQKAMQQRTNMLDWATGHVTQQREVALDVEINSSKQVAMDAALNDSRPQIVNQSIADIKAKNAFIANRKGYDDVWIQAQNARDMEKLHAGILQNAMDQDSVGGVQGYLQAHGGEIDASLRAKAEKWVHNKVIDETAGSYADELLANGVSYSEAKAIIKDKFSGDDEDKYISKLRQSYSEMRQEKAAQEGELIDSINRDIIDGGSVTKIKPDKLEKLKDVAPDKYLNIKASQDEQLERDAAGLTGRKFSDVNALAEVNKKLMFAQMTDADLQIYKPFLSDKDYIAAQDGLSKNKIVSEKEMKDAYMIGMPETDRKRLEKVGDWKTEDYNDFFTFRRIASERLVDTANPEGLRKLSADLWRKGYLKGTGIIFEDSATGIRALSSGQYGKWKTEEVVPRNAITDQGFRDEEKAAEADRNKAVIQQAQGWAKSHPDDPRSAEILKRLGQ